jgi:hypothetical protein
MNGSYHSRTKDPNQFRGARVDLAARIVHLENAAVCNPSPAIIPTNVEWLGDYGYTTDASKFKVYLNDANRTEYGPFDLP